MKRIIVAFAIIAATTAAAQAEDVWAGDSYIYESSGDCGGWSWKGDHFYARYTPKTAANGNQTRMSWFELDNWALAFILNGRDFDSIARPVTYATIWYGVKNVPSTASYAPKVKFASVMRTPSASVTTSSTKFINVTGVIENFDNAVGCTVNFRMSLNKVDYQ